MVCPRAVNASVSGVTATVVGAGTTTVSCARPVTPDEVAVTATSPALVPVTRPDVSTTATDVSPDAHVNSAPATACPFASTASASNRTVSRSTTVSAAGETSTVLTVWATVTAAVPDAEPAVAVIVATPLAAAVTRPAASTAATIVSALVHATGSPSITRSIWSRTSAMRCRVSPSAVNASESGATDTVVGTGSSTTSAPRPVTPDEVAVTATSPALVPVTRPDVSTTATDVSPDAHVNSAPATACPFASTASASNRTVSRSTTVSAAGETSTVLTVWATVTAAVPDAEPAVAVIVAAPLAAAVTSPEASTAATIVSVLVHATGSPSITRSIWSRTSAMRCRVSPSAVNASESGATDTVVGTGSSTTSAPRPVTPDEVAVTATSPALLPVTRPDASTTATDVSPDAHVNSAPATACPFASLASAPNRTVSRSTTVSAAGETSTVLTCCATVTAAVPDAEPDAEPAVAVIVAAPLAAAVTSPDPSTAATEAALLDQLTAAPAITCPYWSSTWAWSCTVAPSAVSSAVAGVTVTVVGRGGSGGGGSVPPSPHARGPQRAADRVAAATTRIR